MPPEGFEPFRQWLRIAESDLAVARAPLPSGALYEQLCFHAQQAAEKSLKAVLIFRDVDFPRTHSIEHLVELLPPDVSRPAFLREAANLTDYAVTLRYPPTRESVDEEEYLEAVRLAEAVVAWAKDYLATQDAE